MAAKGRIRACLHGGEGPLVGGVTRLSIYYYFLFYYDHVHMIGGVTRLGLTLSAGVTICHVNVSRWGNPPSRGRVHGKKLNSKTCMFQNFVHFLAVSRQKSPETATDTQGV